MVMTLEERIRRIESRTEILETHYAYCRHADMNDVDGMLSVFTEECHVTYLAGKYEYRSRAELREGLLPLIDHTVSGSHYLANPELLFESEHAVAVHLYMYSWQRFSDYPVTADCHRWGRYENRLVRTGDGWRFTNMTLVSAGEYGGARIGEQFGRPWPPRFS